MCISGIIENCRRKMSRKKKEWKTNQIPTIQSFSNFEYTFYPLGTRRFFPTLLSSDFWQQLLMSHSNAVLNTVHTSRHPHWLTKRQAALPALSWVHRLPLIGNGARTYRPRTTMERFSLARSQRQSCICVFVAKMRHGLEQCMVPTKTAHHGLEGDGSCAAASCGE